MSTNHNQVISMSNCKGKDCQTLTLTGNSIVTAFVLGLAIGLTLKALN